jgi:hypothetical protein
MRLILRKKMKLVLLNHSSWLHLTSSTTSRSHSVVGCSCSLARVSSKCGLSPSCSQSQESTLTWKATTIRKNRSLTLRWQVSTSTSSHDQIKDGST